MDFLIVLLFMGLELVFPNSSKWQNPFTRKFFWSDVFFLVLLGYMGLEIVFYGVQATFYLRREFGGIVGFKAIRQIPLWWQFCIALVVRDFMGYWMHRFTHAKYLWPFHIAHHEPDHLDAAASFRVHPVNFIFNASRPALLFFLGFDLAVLPLLGIILFVHNIYVHMNVSLDFGRFEMIIISPRMHRLHHSTHPKLYGKNYGMVFGIWDVMFGTYSKSSESEPKFEVGIEGHVRKNTWGTLFEPFLMVWGLAKAALTNSQIEGPRPNTAEVFASSFATESSSLHIEKEILPTGSDDIRR
ncbi:hypothetical protein BH10BDE1_BH10BDE1_07830 [soil metagenome]